MSSDSGYFRDEPGPDRLPVYEAKMVHQFDDRFGTFAGYRRGEKEVRQLPRPTVQEMQDPDYRPLPRYWVERGLLDERLQRYGGDEWLMGWRDVTAATPDTVRTVISAVIPRVAVVHNMPLLFSPRPEFPLLLANLNSFALDWVARQKVGGTHLTFGVLEQLPVLTPGTYSDPAGWVAESLADWLRQYLGELAYTTRDLRPYGAALGWEGPPFRWDVGRRAQLRAEIDAAFFGLYGFDRDAVDYVMESFPTVRKHDLQSHLTYQTKNLILDAYDAMAAATPDRPFASRLDPPPGDPRAAHPPRPGEEPGHWAPWAEVLARAPQAAPAARSARTAAVPPAKPSPASPTRATQEPAPSLFAADPASVWQPEAAVAPSEILMGARVRHRAKGEGIVLSVRQSGKSTELLIRFDATGEAWIAFGYGVLEFEIANGGSA